MNNCNQNTKKRLISDFWIFVIIFTVTRLGEGASSAKMILSQSAPGQNLSFGCDKTEQSSITISSLFPKGPETNG